MCSFEARLTGDLEDHIAGHENSTWMKERDFDHENKRKHSE